MRELAEILRVSLGTRYTQNVGQSSLTTREANGGTAFRRRLKRGAKGAPKEASDFSAFLKPYNSSQFLIISIKYNHTSQDSVSVVKTTFKAYGKMQTLTLSQPKTHEPIVTKFEWRDYVVDAYHQKKFL